MKVQSAAVVVSCLCSARAFHMAGVSSSRTTVVRSATSQRTMRMSAPNPFYPFPSAGAQGERCVDGTDAPRHTHDLARDM
jgi:hypothetical protein